MSSLNLDLDYFEHPKIKRLVGILGKGAEVYPIRLWAHCGKFLCEDGRFSEYSVGEIESLAGWQGEPGELIKVMLKLKLIEKDGETYCIHDWLDHAGHIPRFKKQGREMRERRIENKRNKINDMDKSQAVGSSTDSGALSMHKSDDHQHGERIEQRDDQNTSETLPLHSIALQSISVQSNALHSSDKSLNANAGTNNNILDTNKYIYFLSTDEFFIWRDSIARILKIENDTRPTNKFEWKGNENKTYTEDWKLLNNSFFDNTKKKKYLLECVNILDGKLWWCNCVELAIMVAVRVSLTKQIINTMSFVTSILKNPAELCSDVTDGVLKGYKLQGKIKAT